MRTDNSVAPLLLCVVFFVTRICNATSLPPLIAQVEFVKEDVLRVVPLIVAIGQGTYAFAPATFGLIRELGPLWGSAPASAGPWLFIAVVAIQVSAIIAFLLGRQR